MTHPTKFSSKGAWVKTEEGNCFLLLSLAVNAGHMCPSFRGGYGIA
nr:MAG TPA: Glycerol-3-phosphate acyltransferase [Caudoviricetes sp.]